MQTHYEILGVSREATAEEIKDGYRRMAMKWHPDRNPDQKDEAERRFKEISNAYRTLSNPESRREYDRWMAELEQAKSETSSARASSNRAAEEDQWEEEARRIFFEQMLELAFELARRDFDERAVEAALSGLGCPNSIAQAAAYTACRQTHSTPTSKSEYHPVDIRELPWEQARPYYNASVAGIHADQVLTEGRLADLKRARYIVMGWTVFAATLGGAGIGILTKGFDGMFLVYALIGMTVGLPGGLVILLFLPVQRSYAAHVSRAHYLKVFEDFHAGRPAKYGNWNCGACLGSVFWLAWRRMYWASALMLLGLFTPEIVVAILGYTLSERQVDSISRSMGLAGSIAIGIFGTRIYYRTVCARINRVIALPKEAALRGLRDCGGVKNSSLAVMLLAFLIAAAGIEHFVTPTESVQPPPAASAPPAIPIPPPAQVTYTAQQMEELQRQYHATLREFESRYPELNPDSPRYIPALAENVVRRKEAHEKLGHDSVTALRLALRDVGRP